MPKGQRKARNPVEKLQGMVSMMENITHAIIENAGKPEFAASMEALRSKKEAGKGGKSKRNKEASEVAKQLTTYPGLARQTLTFVKGKIGEYKTLGVLEQYKTEPEPQQKKK